ncbi:MAG: membrane protein insertion efficiency factor YidD [Candidatus Marinimicrobia bacterium]|nr:membrane protein insertion efficiency factor YidD [Candidatus Neomarinimicrobiota bacterium]
MNSFNYIITVLDRAVAFPLLFTVYVYKYTLSPIFGSQCRFHPTCSTYALRALKTKTVLRACILIVKRLSKCHPFHDDGFDPVK